MPSETKPYGGKLTNRELEGLEKKEGIQRACELKKIRLTREEVYDLQLIAIGALSPLEGFMGQQEYRRVLEQMCLAHGLLWPLPVTLSVDQKTSSSLREGEEVALLDETGHLLGLLHLREKYPRDLECEMVQIFGTKDEKHPGVKQIKAAPKSDVLLGGDVHLLNRFRHKELASDCLDPTETRRFFQRMGWRKIVGFQDTNPFHRPYEYVQKCALEMADGLLVHILDDDSQGLPISMKMRGARAMLQHYYPESQVLLAVLPIRKRHAGLREALLHAIMRKNYGCTHFVVGSCCFGVEHACPGMGACFSHPDVLAENRQFLDSFNLARLGISLVFVDEVFYCKKCEAIASPKTCPHGSEHSSSSQALEVKRMLALGEIPPEGLIRPEVAQAALEGFRPAEEPAPGLEQNGKSPKKDGAPNKNGFPNGKVKILRDFGNRQAAVA